MSTSQTVPLAWKVWATDEELWLELDDGRRLGVPLAWFPRLVKATPAQRANFEFIGDGEGIHWPDVDEDLSVEALLAGIPAPRGKVTRRVRSRRKR